MGQAQVPWRMKVPALRKFSPGAECAAAHDHGQLWACSSQHEPGRTFHQHCCCSGAQSCPTLCDPMNCSTPGFPALHHLPEFAQTHVHHVGDAIQSSHPLSPPFSSCLQSFPALCLFCAGFDRQCQAVASWDTGSQVKHVVNTLLGFNI